MSTPPSVSHGYVRDAAGTFTSFDPNGSLETAPLAINAAGTIVGVYTTSNGVHGFLRKPDGTIKRLDDPDAKGSTRPESINDKGVVAGNFTDAAGLTHGFVWTK